MPRASVLVALFLLMGLFSGCAATSRQAPKNRIATPSFSPSGDPGWRVVRFRMDRDDGQTHWERDLLLAHRIILPALTDHAQDLYLWRFHRRSADDAAGHQFSFLFYTNTTTANAINRQVLENPFLAGLMNDHVVREIIVDTVEENPKPNIEDTSDPNWSPVMQTTWPYYIMGVSRMWLEMIDRISEETGPADETLPDALIAHYQTVNAEITKIWEKEAPHALLHHLNAIYGYCPMVYWEKRVKTF